MNCPCTVIIGPNGCGKTALLKQLLGTQCAVGICTEKCEADEAGVAPIYLYAYGEAPLHREENCIGFCRSRHSYTHTEIFETLGVALLSNIKVGQTIVIDEIGVMENDVLCYQKMILSLMDRGKNPMFLVCRDKDTAFIREITNHPHVTKLIRLGDNNKMQKSDYSTGEKGI